VWTILHSVLWALPDSRGSVLQHRLQTGATQELIRLQTEATQAYRALSRVDVGCYDRLVRVEAIKKRRGPS